MFRTVRRNENEMDFYCRYLDAQIFLPSTAGNICNGRFSFFLKNLGIQRLPYQLSLVDLITKSALIPDLFVRLPTEYFINWKNFPEIIARFEPSPEGELETAQYHSVHIVPTGIFSTDGLLHPYDREKLQTEFVNNFTSTVPNALTYEKHPNGHTFAPYEVYLSYWRAYIFVEAINGYEDIENFLTRQSGRASVIARFADVSARWEEDYRATFSRVSFYRTAVTILSFWKEKPSITYGELAHFLQAVVKSNADELEHDLESLLILFADWKTRLEAGKRYYPQATEQLRRDIYFMLEWLCGSTGNREAFYFKKWRYKDRMSERWAELKEVVAYEEFELQQMFEDLVPYYVGVLTKNAYVKDEQGTYERLAKHESFWPWIRAFTDLHGSLNPGVPISFRQVRVLDYLLVITVRTEVLIRSIFRTSFVEEDQRDFRLVFNQFSQRFPESSPERRVLGTVADQENWKHTELSGKPDDIFGNIDTLVPKQNWSKSMHHIFTSILRFVTARNYFAHHSFKDESLNNQVSDLARKVLVSCVETAVYIDSITHQHVTH